MRYSDVTVKEMAEAMNQLYLAHEQLHRIVGRRDLEPEERIHLEVSLNMVYQAMMGESSLQGAMQHYTERKGRLATSHPRDDVVHQLHRR